MILCVLSYSSHIFPPRDELGEYSADDLKDEKNYQENIFFGQLG